MPGRSVERATPSRSLDIGNLDRIRAAIIHKRVEELSRRALAHRLFTIIHLPARHSTSTSVQRQFRILTRATARAPRPTLAGRRR